MCNSHTTKFTLSQNFKVVFGVFTDLLSTLISEHFLQPQIKPSTHWQSLQFLPAPEGGLIDLLSVSKDLPILNLSIGGIILYVTFVVCLLLLSIKFSRFIQVVACISTLFLLMIQSCGLQFPSTEGWALVSFFFWKCIFAYWNWGESWLSIWKKLGKWGEMKWSQPTLEYSVGSWWCLLYLLLRERRQKP